MNNKEMELKVASFAQKALLYEVALAPKPGLVDRFNNGAHYDMDIFTFMDAINALTPYLYVYSQIGREHTGTPQELFQKARQVGCRAEASMLKATKNVNTHKGANFSFAVITSASAYIVKEKKLAFPLTAKETEKIFEYVAKMCRGLVEKDFKQLEEKEHLSYGETLFKNYQITGIRGVAEQGYPILTGTAMPYLRKNLLKYPEDTEGVFLHLLTLLMSEAEDTNLIHRGGLASYHNIKNQARDLFVENRPTNIHTKLEEWDQQLTKEHLSPGGAADLLALSLYLAQLENLI